MVPDASPVSEYVVAEEVVSGTMVDQVEPPSADLWISYPVTGAPPVHPGAFHARSIVEDEVAVAVSPVGEEGDVASVVVDAVFDTGPVPTEFVAETLYA